MMRRLSLILLLAIWMPMTLTAQTADRIKADPSYVWAEGRGQGLSDADEAAVDALVRLLSVTEELPLAPSVRQRIWETYRSDIQKCSARSVESPGRVIRYMEWSRIPEIFAARWKKVRELAASAESARQRGDPAAARCYCAWAETYLESLPPGQQALRNRLSRLDASLGAGPVAPLRMRNVESEVRAIRAALSLPAARPDAPSPSPEAAPEKRPAPIVAETPTPREPLPRRQPIQPLAALSPMEYSVPLFYAMPLRLSGTLPGGGRPGAQPTRPGLSVSALLEWDRGLACGLRLSCALGRLDPYVSVRSTLAHRKASYSARSDGATDFGYLWASGDACCRRDALSAGTALWLGRPRRSSPAPRLGVFVGLGCGRSDLLWGDSNGEWARIEDLSARGLLVEGGLQCRIGDFSGLIGLSAIGFSRTALMLGLGWVF